MWSVQHGLCQLYQQKPTPTHYRTHKLQIFDWQTNETTVDNFLVLKKCWTKLHLDCLIYKMSFIQDLKPSLKTCNRTLFTQSYCITHTGMPPNDIYNSTLLTTLTSKNFYS